MSIPDIATLINIRRLAPSLDPAKLSAAFVCWMLRVVTVIIFVAATTIGIQLAAAAPIAPPVSTSAADR